MVKEYFTFGSAHRKILDMTGLPITDAEYNPQYCPGNYFLVDEHCILEVEASCAGNARKVVAHLYENRFAFQYPREQLESLKKNFKNGVVKMPRSLYRWAKDEMGREASNAET